MLSDSVACTEVEVEHRKMGMHHYEHRLVVEKFKTEVVNICTDDAAVFIYVSGIQFPYKVITLSLLASFTTIGGYVHII